MALAPGIRAPSGRGGSGAITEAALL